MATVDIRDVRKSYGSNEVVHGVSARFHDGEFVVIVGPSGCGKSTLLRMIAGLEAITAGEIAIGGRVVNDLEPKARDIAMVFQNYALYPHMTVAENMSFGLRLKRFPKEEIQKRVDEAARILNIEDLLARKPRQLSGGQRQRVAMGRAIVRNPKVFLFDEPLSNLDAKLRVQMRVEIRQLHRSIGATSVFVTHDQTEAMTMADRLVVMNAGNIEQIGSPLEVYDRPASTYVAGFIGSPPMNFFGGEVRDGRATTDGGAALGPAAGAAGPVTIGVRPEHLMPVGPGDGALRGRVRIVEELGGGRLIHLDGPHGPFIANVSVDAPLAEDADGTLGFAVEPRHVHLFDATKGHRIDAAASAEPPALKLADPFWVDTKATHQGHRLET